MYLSKIKLTMNSITLDVRLVWRDQLGVYWYVALRQVIAFILYLQTRLALALTGWLNTSGSLHQGVFYLGGSLGSYGLRS